jgi:hypothetical protein
MSWRRQTGEKHRRSQHSHSGQNLKKTKQYANVEAASHTPTLARHDVHEIIDRVLRERQRDQRLAACGNTATETHIE